MHEHANTRTHERTNTRTHERTNTRTHNKTRNKNTQHKKHPMYTRANKQYAYAANNKTHKHAETQDMQTHNSRFLFLLFLLFFYFFISFLLTSKIYMIAGLIISQKKMNRSLAVFKEARKAGLAKNGHVYAALVTKLCDFAQPLYALSIK